jgi:predicted phosphoribosyltransferase
MKTILPPDVIDMMEQDQTNVSITLSPANDYGVGWHYGEFKNYYF